MRGVRRGGELPPAASMTGLLVLAEKHDSIRVGAEAVVLDALGVCRT